MKQGEKVLCEGDVTAIGAGFVRVRFPRVGAEAVSHVRVATENVRQKPGRKTAGD